MIDFLFQYGLFLAKAVTIAAVVGAVLVAVVRARRGSQAAEEHLEITDLNDKYRETGRALTECRRELEAASAVASRVWGREFAMNAHDGCGFALLAERRYDESAAAFAQAPTTPQPPSGARVGANVAILDSTLATRVEQLTPDTDDGSGDVRDSP